MIQSWYWNLQCLYHGTVITINASRKWELKLMHLITGIYNVCMMVMEFTINVSLYWELQWLLHSAENYNNCKCTCIDSPLSLFLSQCFEFGRSSILKQNSLGLYTNNILKLKFIEPSSATVIYYINTSGDKGAYFTLIEIGVWWRIYNMSWLIKKV